MPLQIEFKDGKSVREEVLRELQVTPHRVECVIYARRDRAAADEWVRIPVSEASVQVNDPGEPAVLTLTTVPPLAITRVVMESGEAVVKPILSNWGQEVEITPWGTWLQVYQFVYAAGNDDNPIVVPWGAFVVIDVDTEANTQRVIAEDALAMLDFRSYVNFTLSRVVKGDDLRARIEELLKESWPEGTDPWPMRRPWDDTPAPGLTPISRWLAHPAGGIALGTDQYDGESRLALVRSLLARDEMDTTPEDDRVIAMTVTADPDMTSMYVLRPEFDLRSEPDNMRDIKAGQGLVGMRERKSRDGIVNRAIVTWADDKDDTVQTDQQRTTVDLVGYTSDEVGKVYVGQRFGLQTRDESASDITSEADAANQGRRIIERSLFEATTWDIICSPVYGLMIDDTVSVADPYGNIGAGRVVGMRVGLTSQGEWSLSVLPTNIIDAISFGKPSTDIIPPEDLGGNINSWRTIYRKVINEGMKKATGWTYTGGTPSYNTTGTRVRASASELVLRTVEAYSPTSHNIAKASVQIGTTPGEITVRVGLATSGTVTWGEWETIRKGLSKTVSSGVVKVGAKFGVRIEVKGAPTGKLVDFNGLSVEVPGLDTESQSKDPSYRFPIPGRKVTTSFGTRGRVWSCSKDSSGRGLHTGADISAPCGTRIVAVSDGTVRHVSYGAAFGSHQFVIEASDGSAMFYAHTSTRPANGASVKVGDSVAKVGSEGVAFGCHLHLEYHRKYVGTSGWKCSTASDPTSKVGKSG